MVHTQFIYSDWCSSIRLLCNVAVCSKTNYIDGSTKNIGNEYCVLIFHNMRVSEKVINGDVYTTYDPTNTFESPEGLVTVKEMVMVR